MAGHSLRVHRELVNPDHLDAVKRSVPGNLTVV